MCVDGKVWSKYKVMWYKDKYWINEKSFGMLNIKVEEK